MIGGYRYYSIILEDGNTQVWRGIREKDNLPVLIKTVRGNPSPHDRADFHHEYKMTRKLSLEGIVPVINIEEDEHSICLVYQDPGGDFLSGLTQAGHMDLRAVLLVGIRTADILGELHQKGIVHKDIRPSCIIVNIPLGMVKITGLAIAQDLTWEELKMNHGNSVEGTSQYMSPEQTGRMNRSVDYRTDFYSLGVTLYQLVCGRLPFSCQDTIEWMHCHIAKIPPSPNHVDPSIPHVLSRIIMKLMSKNAEDRYQSAFGVRIDLERCLEQFVTMGTIAEFAIAQRDISERLNIPQKLYGRNREIKMMMETLGQVSAGSNGLILVSGAEGTGKSSLVREICASSLHRGGLFAEGRFERYKLEIPYSAIITIVRELVGHLLLTSQENLDTWRQAILKAVGSNGQVVIDVIPDVEMMIGKQEPVPELGASETTNRFNRVFLEFIRVFASKNHPLILVFDDLEYADSASLHLLETLLSDDNGGYLLVIGTYTDMQTEECFPLSEFIRSMEDALVDVRKIVLQSLSVDDVTDLFTDMMVCSRVNAQPLARVICEKTGGNPFFTIAFIRMLYINSFLFFDTSSGTWSWDLGKIGELGITDNVIALHVEKIEKLPAQSREVLRIASCIGGTFDLKTLTMVSSFSAENTLDALWNCIHEGLVIPLGEAYKVRDISAMQTVRYRILHDRVQEAACFMMPQDEAAAIHLKTGRILLDSTPSEMIEESIFRITGHFNKAISLITDNVEKVRVAGLNRIAGRRAKASSAYHQAVSFLSTGVRLLPDDVWKTDYPLAFNIYRELSECEYLDGNHEKAEELFDLILCNAQIDLDKAEIYSIRIVLYANIGMFVRNNTLGIEALRMFGIKLPSPDDRAAMEKAFQEQLSLYRILMKDTSMQDLYNIHETDNPERRMCFRILVNMFSSAYVSNPVFLMVITITSLNLSLKYGISPDAIYAFCVWGIVLNLRFREYATAFDFGMLALKFNERFNNVMLRSNIPFVLGNFISHWKCHIRDSVGFLREGFRAGEEIGDYIYASFSATSFPRYMLSCGHDHLETVLAEIDGTLSFFRRIRNEASLERQQILRHVVLNLLGRTPGKSSLNDEIFNESTHLKIMEDIQYGTGIALYYYYRMFILYTRGFYREAFEMSHNAIRNLQYIGSSIQEADTVFYSSLCMIRLYPESDPDTRKEFMNAIRANITMIATWRENCPQNFTCKNLILDAEMARLDGNYWHAGELFDDAISDAGKNGFLSMAALAAELCGEMYVCLKRETIAAAYLKEALSCYRSWGAYAKVDDMLDLYGVSLNLGSNDHAAPGDTQPADGDAGNKPYGAVDLLSVIKASQAISGEIILDRLIERLMHILVENAGADRGILVLERDGILNIMARTRIDREPLTLLDLEPMDAAPDAPLSILNYVIRTSETVVLDDAAHEGRFVSDPYIKNNQSRSILCIPIVEQAHAIGMLYLENSLMKGSFTDERIDVLKMLSSQAAVALKNALNYDEINRTKESLKASERNYRLLFQNLQDVFYRTDNDGKVIFASPSVEKVLGYSLYDFIGVNIAKVLYSDPAERVQFLDNLDTRGYVEDYEIKVRRKDGVIIWVATNSHYYYDETGEMAGVEGMIRNITERKRAEELLLAEKERLSVTLRSIGDGVITTDVNGYIVLLNRAGEKLTGWTQEDALGKKLSEVYHVSDEKTGAVLNRNYNENAVPDIPGKPVLLGRDGVERVIADSIAPIRDRESTVIGSIVVFRDITEQRKMENEILKNQKLESLGILAGGIAHDFNNILTGIMGNVSLARMYAKADSGLCDRLMELEKASLRARDLTQQLLTFSKGGNPVKKTVSLAELIKESARFVLSGSNVKCQFDFEERMWPVAVDEGQINQVLNNIIINATQSMPGGGSIYISALNVHIDKDSPVPLRPGRYVRVSIRDEGVGIPQEILHRIFDPFFTTKSRGNGLGLSTTYSIIQKHDGHIMAESEIGKGTVFHIYLPSTGREGSVAAEHEEENGFEKIGGRVLLMDDESMVRDVGLSMLAYLGFEADAAADGLDAVEKYKQAIIEGKPYKLLIMDLTVPGGIGGKEAIRVIKKINPDVKAIVSSGYSNDPVMANYRSYGFSGVIVKPYRVNDIRDVVKKVLSES